MTYREVIQDWMNLREMVHKEMAMPDLDEAGHTAALLFAGYWIAQTCQEKRGED